MDKSIKQIAEELGIDKQRVYRYIKRFAIKESHQKNSVMYYDEIAQTAIKQGLINACASNKAHQEPDENLQASLVELLSQELKAKNNEIRELHARLAESNAALLAAQKLLQGSQALHAGSLQRLPGVAAQASPVHTTSRRPPARKRPEPKPNRLFDYLDSLFDSK